MDKKSFKLNNRIIVLIIVLLLIVLLIIGLTLYFVLSKTCNTPSNSDSVPKYKTFWGYNCKDGKCYRIRGTNNTKDIMGLSTCFLTCIPGGTLWPIPRGVVSISKEIGHIDLDEIKFNATNTYQYYDDCKSRFYKNLYKKIAKNQIDNKNGKKLTININITNEFELFTIETNEEYKIFVHVADDNTFQGTIIAENYVGIRHGLETFLNLIVQDELTHKLVMPAKVYITDKPFYKHRGILIDTITNYIPVKSLKRTIDTMSRVKLNVLHWYIGGTLSFPLVINLQPELNEFGRFSDTKIYTSQNIIDIIEYGKSYGIKVIPEFDTPGNIGAGWEESNVTIPCKSYQSTLHHRLSQFDITNKKLYIILDKIIAEIYENFQNSEFIHLGGRSVSIKCWNSSKTIRDFLNKYNFKLIDKTYLELWTIYLDKIVRSYEKLNSNQKFIISHDTFVKNSMAKHILLPKKVTIQLDIEYNSDDLMEFLKDGYNIIISYDLSSDNWQHCYLFNYEMNFTNGIIGGEALLWTSFTDEYNLDVKLWPILSAMAENLWTHFNNDLENVEKRMLYHRSILVKNGIRAKTVESEWCLQNEADCLYN